MAIEIDKFVNLAIMLIVMLVVLIGASYIYTTYVYPSIKGLGFETLSTEEQSKIIGNFDSLTDILQKCAASQKMNCWCNSDHQFPVGFPKEAKINIKRENKKSVISLMYGKNEIKNATINSLFAILPVMETSGQFEITFFPADVDNKNIVAAFYKAEKIYLFNEGQIKEEWKKNFKVEDCINENPYNLLCVSVIHYNNFCLTTI